MNTARYRLRSLSPLMMACLGLGLCLVDAGCSGISGCDRSAPNGQVCSASGTARNRRVHPLLKTTPTCKPCGRPGAAPKRSPSEMMSPLMNGDNNSTNKDIELADDAESRTVVPKALDGSRRTRASGFR